MVGSKLGGWTLVLLTLVSGSALAQSNADKEFFDAGAKVDDKFKYSPDAESALAVLRATAPGRVKLRQADFAATKTYRNPGKSRCLFASEPFADGENKSLSFYFTASTPKLYVRCWVADDVKTLRLSGWTPYIRLSVNNALGWGSPTTLVQVDGDDKSVLEATFDLPPADLKADDFAFVDATVGVEKITGYRSANGKAVPTYDLKSFGKFSFFWEKQDKVAAAR